MPGGNPRPRASDGSNNFSLALPVRRFCADLAGHKIISQPQSRIHPPLLLWSYGGTAFHCIGMECGGIEYRFLESVCHPKRYVTCLWEREELLLLCMRGLMIAVEAARHRNIPTQNMISPFQPQHLKWRMHGSSPTVLRELAAGA